MRNIVLFTRDQRYQLALFGILVTSSLISIGIFMMRTRPSEHGPYTSLVWNLALAWVPLILAWIVFSSIRLPRLPRFALISICTVLWIIFFPNAFYILTDFQHIRLIDTPTPVWYDVIMLLWFSWSGVFLGLLSLYLMQRVAARYGGKIIGWIFVACAVILNSVGVYIGRFQHENSWNLIQRPLRLSRGIMIHILRDREQALTFFILFGFLSFFMYITFYLFAQAINERQNSK